jgi:hypothetical protein
MTDKPDRFEKLIQILKNKGHLTELEVTSLKEENEDD